MLLLGVGVNNHCPSPYKILMKVVINMILRNRCICMSLCALSVMSFFVIPVSADEYYEDAYYEDVQVDEEPTEETEYIETETFLPETTLSNSDIEVQITNYITAGAIKIVGAYYGVEIPDAVSLKIAEIIRPVIADYNSFAVSEYVYTQIIDVVKNTLGEAPEGFEDALKQYIYSAFEEEMPVEEFNYFVPIISSLSFISVIGLLLWIGL